MSSKDYDRIFKSYRRYLSKFKTTENEVLFRPHGSSLKECLRQIAIVSSKEDICKLFNEKGYLLGRTIVSQDIEVKPYCYDSRIEWNTYIVTIKGDAAGFTNRPVE